MPAIDWSRHWQVCLYIRSTFESNTLKLLVCLLHMMALWHSMTVEYWFVSCIIEFVLIFGYGPPLELLIWRSWELLQPCQRITSQMITQAHVTIVTYALMHCSESKWHLWKLDFRFKLKELQSGALKHNTVWLRVDTSVRLWYFTIKPLKFVYFYHSPVCNKLQISHQIHSK